MEVLLANPRGFCAGVVRAVEIVEQALELYGPPVYVLHQIVHNPKVVRDLEQRGVVFMEDLDTIPTGALTIFSAHGVGRRVARAARERGLDTVDATCPLVSKVHLQARKYSREGRELILIGHRRHVEVQGTLGQLEGPARVVATPEEVDALEVAAPDRLAYVTQTTLSLDDTREVVAALKRRFPTIRGPDLSGICYATQNRQNAVRQLAGEVDLLLVVGARNSSNCTRLREVGERHGLAAHLVESPAEVRPPWLRGAERIGVTSGASTPEVLVDRVLHRLRGLGAARVRELAGEPETTSFRIPIAEIREAHSPARK
ncbi:4-hydroxy-3-methylbut-2-enyl diphosphate reductase [Thiohalorhabdus methylotrophus]|uniref:4-hydroxy-3-methylbut-2-enyl diphosphate reductase n=1 Tax=Thiohalorhabdus methylotrophus TaxID=3242694 RepID=A0ABV4TV37_9GAMM